MSGQFSFILTAQLFAIADSAIRSVSCLKTVRTVGKVIGSIRGVVAIKTVGKVIGFIRGVVAIKTVGKVIGSIRGVVAIKTVGKVIGFIRGVVAIKTVGKVIGSIRGVVAIKRVASCAARRRTVGTFFNFIWFAIKFSPILKFFFVHVFTCYYLGLNSVIWVISKPAERSS